MNSIFRKSAVALACLAASAASAQGADKPEYGAWGVDLTAMDLKVKPGNDFNRYASGAWMERTVIPADKPMASLRYLMTDRTEGRLHQLMEAAAAAVPAQPSTLEEKIGGFYKSFMDEPKIEALGAGAIATELNAIRTAANRDDIAELMGHNSNGFFATVISLNIDVDLKNVSRYALYANQAGLGLPDRDYYLQPSFAAQETAYQSYVADAIVVGRVARAEVQRRGSRCFRDANRRGELGQV